MDRVVVVVVVEVGRCRAGSQIEICFPRALVLEPGGVSNLADKDRHVPHNDYQRTGGGLIPIKSQSTKLILWT